MQEEEKKVKNALRGLFAPTPEPPIIDLRVDSKEVVADKCLELISDFVLGEDTSRHFYFFGSGFRERLSLVLSALAIDKFAFLLAEKKLEAYISDSGQVRDLELALDENSTGLVDSINRLPRGGFSIPNEKYKLEIEEFFKHECGIKSPQLLRLDHCAGVLAVDSEMPLDENVEVTLLVLAARLSQQLLLSRTEELSRVDCLTGQLRFSYYCELGEYQVHVARETKTPLSLAFFNIDNQREINDTYGFHYSDEVIKMTASKVREFLSAGILCARSDGDEFCILAPGKNMDEMYRLAEKIRAAFEKPLLVKQVEGGHFSVQVTVSSGVSQHSETADNFKSLLEEGKTALKQAKAEGKNRTRVFGRAD